MRNVANIPDDTESSLESKHDVLVELDDDIIVTTTDDRPTRHGDMTQAQKDNFVAIATAGVAMGLSSPEEWLGHYLYQETLLMPAFHVPMVQQQALETFAAFYRMTASHPDDPIADVTADTIENVLMERLEAKRRMMRYAREHHDTAIDSEEVALATPNGEANPASAGASYDS